MRLDELKWEPYKHNPHDYECAVFGEQHTAYRHRNGYLMGTISIIENHLPGAVGYSGRLWQHLEPIEALCVIHNLTSNPER